MKLHDWSPELSSPRNLVIHEESKRRTKRAFSGGTSCRESLLMNYHNYAISDVVFITILFIWPASLALHSRCCFPLVTFSFLCRNEGTRSSQEDEDRKRCNANVNETSFLSRWWEQARKRKRRRWFETRANSGLRRRKGGGAWLLREHLQFAFHM